MPPPAIFQSEFKFPRLLENSVRTATIAEKYFGMEGTWTTSSMLMWEWGSARGSFWMASSIGVQEEGRANLGTSLSMKMAHCVPAQTTDALKP